MPEALGRGRQLGGEQEVEEEAEEEEDDEEGIKSTQGSEGLPTTDAQWWTVQRMGHLS